MTKITPNTPMEKLTPGGDIYEAGNAKEFKTGDWRSVKPVWIEEKCKQCGLCYPVCPDNSIPVATVEETIVKQDNGSQLVTENVNINEQDNLNNKDLDSSPKTSDESNIYLAIVGVIASAIVGIGIYCRKKMRMN